MLCVRAYCPGVHISEAHIGRLNSYIVHLLDNFMQTACESLKNGQRHLLYFSASIEYTVST